MKYKLIVLFLLFSFSTFSQETSNLKWLHSYEKAVKKSKRNKKPIVLYFSGSDWCRPCKRLKKDLFETASFEKISKKLNLLYVDIPQNRDIISEKQYKHNKELMHQLNPRKVFPMVMILNKKGKVENKLSGYGSAEEPTAYLNMIKESIR